MRKKIAFYGGSFDHVHRGHLAIGDALLSQFGLAEFVFIPAFHAPHKRRTKPTSAYDRYAMLCLATQGREDISVSRMEFDMPERPFSIETLGRLNEIYPNDQIFFVMGADSWMDIRTWREWEKVLSVSDHIVVTRPGYEIGFDHVTDEIRQRIVDLRGGVRPNTESYVNHIFITDAVSMDISATEIRYKIRNNDPAWRDDVPGEVAKYIEKYQIYK
ncbi:MAG: nicotinate (nicotinamide) nucleotide adenylyltransferase [Acidobacteria bacterium]|nr:nicotinate (nicotinamide) nucleotide adenylyltransferase [Acidobacteriota bacterium]